MTQVLHLVRHDLRTHQRLLLAWLVVVLAHPLTSLLDWPALSATGIAAPSFLIVCRLLLAAVALATIVQADSPLDDRTFWRTRPVAARTMAAAKLTTGAIFVAVPLLVVLLVAALVRVPMSHLPSTIAQVVVTDAAALGVVLFIACRTRTVASMVIALLVTLGVSVILRVGIAETSRVPWLRPFYAAGPPSPELATPTMLLVIALAALTMTAMAFLGQRYRLRLLLVGAGGALALAIVWFVPAARLHQPPPRFERRPSLSVDASQVRAERLGSGRIALMTRGNLTGLQPGDRSRQVLSEGTFDTDDGPVAADQPFVAVQPGPHPVFLGSIGESDFTRLAGQPVRFRGRVVIEVSRTEVIGTMPLVAGAHADVGQMRLRIRDLRPSVQMRPPLVPLATVDVTWAATWTHDEPVAATQWRLRRGAERESVYRFMETPFVGIGLLPSLARPFGHERSVLYVPQGLSSAIEAGSFLDIEVNRGRVHTELPIRLDFVVPATATPYDAARASR